MTTATTNSLAASSFCASLTSRGTALPLYDSTTTDKSATAYVESSGGQQFAIITENNLATASESYDVSVWIDDRKVGGTVYSSDSDVYKLPLGSKERREEFKGVRTWPDRNSVFLFGQLAITGKPERACQDSELATKRGTIEVRVCRVQNVAKLEGDGEKEGYGRMSARKFEVDAPGEATHQVKYGPDIKTAPDTRATFELVDPATEPFVRLQFKYRSRVEPEPSPTLAGSSRASSPLTPVSGASSPSRMRDVSPELFASMSTPATATASATASPMDVDLDEDDVPIATLIARKRAGTAMDSIKALKKARLDDFDDGGAAGDDEMSELSEKERKPVKKWKGKEKEKVKVKEQKKKK